MADNDTFTETTTTGWVSRLGGAFKGILVGAGLFAAATGFLYWNEGRSVQAGDAIAEAQMVTVELPSIASVDKAFEGKMVHATGRADTKDVIADPEFGVKANALSVSRSVEYYQWTEHAKTETRKKLGGGEEKVTTYSYKQEWVDSPVDSERFKVRDGHVNKVATTVKDETWYAQNVQFGAYTLPDFLSHSIGGKQPLNVELTQEELVNLQSQIYPSQNNNVFYTMLNRATMLHTSGNTLYVGRQPASPRIGDVRVTYNQVLPQDISIIAKQYGNTFVSFTASNGNTFSKLASGVVPMETMFQSAKSANETMTWILRVLGAIAVIAGLKMIVAPIAVLADVIPLLGSIIGAGTGAIATLIGIAWSLIVIAVAWIRFRPVLGLCLLGGALVLIVLLFIKGRKGKAAKAGTVA